MSRAAARNNVLSFNAFRRARERRRARMLEAVDQPASLQASHDPGALSERQRCHRRAMLRHGAQLLARRAAMASSDK